MGHAAGLCCYADDLCDLYGAARETAKVLPRVPYIVLTAATAFSYHLFQSMRHPVRGAREPGYSGSLQESVFIYFFCTLRSNISFIAPGWNGFGLP